MQMMAKKAKKYSSFSFCHWLPSSGPDWKTGHRSAVIIFFEHQLWEVQQSQNWHKHQVAGLHWEARFYRQCYIFKQYSRSKWRCHTTRNMLEPRPVPERGFGGDAYPRLLFLIPIPLPLLLPSGLLPLFLFAWESWAEGKDEQQYCFLKTKQK